MTTFARCTSLALPFLKDSLPPTPGTLLFHVAHCESIAVHYGQYLALADSPTACVLGRLWIDGVLS